MPGFEAKKLSFDMNEFDFDSFIFNSTMFPALFNTTEPSLTSEFAYLINATSLTNLRPQNIHERAEVILLQPETILIMVLSFLALLANFLSLCATVNIPGGLTTHSRLILSLGLSDVLVTLSVFIHILNKVLNPPKIPPLFSPEERAVSSCTFATIISLNTMAHLISLLNLLAMAVDHYVAILKPLQYYSLLSKTKGIVMIVCMWILAFFGGFSNFLTGLGNVKEKAAFFNYCELIMYNDFHGEYLVIAATFICLISIISIYVRIYFEVKTINCRMTAMQKDPLHNKKALITTLLIIGTFIMCWLPTCVFQVAMVIQIHLDKEIVRKFFGVLLRANKYLYALLLLNSLCDPIIYAVRLRDVQMGYYKLLSKCFKFYKMKILEERENRSSYVSRRGTNTKTSSFYDVEEGKTSDSPTRSDPLFMEGDNHVMTPTSCSTLLDNNSQVLNNNHEELRSL